jgi:LCP family protein required for cell wall assembly
LALMVAHGDGRGSGRPGPVSLLTKPPVSAGTRARHVVLGLVSALVFVLVIGGWASSSLLTGNISKSRLYLGLGSQGKEKADSAGRSPMNILVIGSDTRATAQDCALGGGCGPGGNADVEMLVHLSANRTNATVLSIPRDTIVEIPACQDPKTGHVYPAMHGQITSSLQHGGPGCTVATVHSLTGAVIDHFAMVDFGGVVNLSDAVGGVTVCVDNNVFDTYSRLKLSKGTHTLTGVAALEFVRTRHGFGNGGDIGREAAQHVFLASLINKLKDAHTLTNPVALYRIANAATSALTVDDGLAGVNNLIALAGQLNDVPTNRITFATMPNVPYPTNPNWISPAPSAQAVFQAIDNDQSLSGAPALATAGQPTSPAATTAPPVVTVDPASVSVTVENGSGISGRASAVRTALRAAGFTLAVVGGNAQATATTRLVYAPADQTAAQSVATALGLPVADLSSTGSSASLRLVIGADWSSGTMLSHPTAVATGPVTPPTDAAALNAAATPGCVAVGTEDTTPFGSPIRAYAMNPQVPDSDAPGQP